MPGVAKALAAVMGEIVVDPGRDRDRRGAVGLRDQARDDCLQRRPFRLRQEAPAADAVEPLALSTCRVRSLNDGVFHLASTS